MKACRSCGKKISDDALFCKYCGAEAESNALSEADIVREKEELESLGLEMRGLCDRMTAAYVDAAVRLRRAEKANAGSESELRRRLSAVQQELEDEKAYSAELESKLRRAVDVIRQLKESDGSRAAAESRPTVCPRCGRPINRGATFCGNCGTRLG